MSRWGVEPMIGVTERWCCWPERPRPVPNYLTSPHNRHQTIFQESSFSAFPLVIVSNHKGLKIFEVLTIAKKKENLQGS